MVLEFSSWHIAEYYWLVPKSVTFGLPNGFSLVAGLQGFVPSITAGLNSLSNVILSCLSTNGDCIKLLIFSNFSQVHLDIIIKTMIANIPKFKEFGYCLYNPKIVIDITNIVIKLSTPLRVVRFIFIKDSGESNQKSVIYIL